MSVDTTNRRVSRRAGMFCHLWVVVPLIALVLVVPAPRRKLPIFRLGQASGSVWVYRPAWRAWMRPPLLPLSTVLSEEGLSFNFGDREHKIEGTHVMVVQHSNNVATQELAIE